MGATGSYWETLRAMGMQQDLSGPNRGNWELLGGNWDILGATGTDWDRLGDTELWGRSRTCRVLTGATGRFWEATGSYWELLGHTGSYWDILGATGSYGDILEDTGRH